MGRALHLYLPNTVFLLTTEEAAKALGRSRSEFSRLINHAPDDPAVKLLLKGRSGSGKLSRWHVESVAEAAESLLGREWPVRRRGERLPAQDLPLDRVARPA